MQELAALAIHTVRRSISMTHEVHLQLTQLAARRGRDVTESDLIREAIREYLDQQADVVGSRRHFQKSLQRRIDALEDTLTFQMHILIALLSMLIDEPDQAVDEAIVAARRDGPHLRARIEAVCDLNHE